LKRALDVVNVGGVPTCQSVVDGTDPNCVPFNVFTLAGHTGGVTGLIPGGVTPAALAYLQVPLVQTGATIQQDVIGKVTGDLGFTFPAAETPVAVSAGFEYRRDELDSTTDTEFSSGDGAGQGGPTLGLNGHTDVQEVFGEARVPLIEHKS